MKKQILFEIATVKFVSIIFDETTDIADMFQLVVVFRYKIKDQPVERF